ncbi:MAG TPA: tRNA (adenosine(37)-N6)-threonylcarbamoyltransferase complex dimerization subunit type 1 TsaB [Armatimonadota bacterium]|jgi:tRNA threonylcarbamoyladenosine biosynthesis protein TsaB
MPLVLGIETATQWCAVALWNENGPLASHSFVNAMELSRRLVPTIEALLMDEGLTPEDLTGIAVSIGPGSFTGLRIGVATAKTMAQVLNIPIIGVETMDVIALTYEPLLLAGTRLAVTLTSRRGQYYVRWYEPPTCPEDRTIEVLTTNELREQLALSHAGVLLLGDAALNEGLPGTGMPILEGAHRPHALNVAYLAYPRIVRGESDDVMTLAPLYVGRSAAEERRSASPATGA